MDDAVEQASSKDTKERMAGVEKLHQVLESSRNALSANETSSLVHCCMDLLIDSNFKVSQGGLQALASAAVLSGENLKLHFNYLLPAVVDRLGDHKQPVRDAAQQLILTLMEISSSIIIVEKAGSSAWTHNSWRVREEFVRTVTAAIARFAPSELTLLRSIVPHILLMLNDPNLTVREASLQCIEGLHCQFGPQFRHEIQRHHLPQSMLKDIDSRLEKIEPQGRLTDEISVDANVNVGESKPINNKKSSPSRKSVSKEASIFPGAFENSENPVDPFAVYSEKELIKEFEKITATLIPDMDWSLRIAAMQRTEAIVLGGASQYPSFRGLLKQLSGSLIIQLSDRRSSIVKQACHLVNFLSKELLGDFESCAEILIPVLFKLVVITVLVIAESADNCIKTMLRNCKVSRVLPRIVESAKSDRNSVLRSRCCEYALLFLEHWTDTPDVHRSADLYEDLIKCCVSDAISEVRSTARICYRMFAKTWPDRSRRLFSSFDPAIQRLVNEEDRGLPKRHASPVNRERSPRAVEVSHVSTPSPVSGYGTSTIVAMDRTSSLFPGSPSSFGLATSQPTSVGKSPERSLESVLHSSKQKVSAIESMLRDLEVYEKKKPFSLRSSSLDAAVDPPSYRDPPFPATASLSLPTEETSQSGFSKNGGMDMNDIILQIQSSKYISRSLNRKGNPSGSRLTFSEYSQKKSVDENLETFEVRSMFNTHLDSEKVSNFQDIPSFQRPLLRKHASGKVYSGRRSFDGIQNSLGDSFNLVERPASLVDAINEGLNPSSDWKTRVSAFCYLQSLLQQGPKGVLEVCQSFEKLMKLFFQHLHDPHHKVAQAALSTLSDIIQSCPKPFESYIERTLPHVFSRLIDPKEVVRQPSSAVLEIVSKTYNTATILPAMLRSLDEQRSPKAKLAVMEFAINSFKNHVSTTEGTSNPGILKLWLAKITPLSRDKNTKLKDAAINCFISVYSHFDPIGVLNYILSLSVEDQNVLRRALKQHTPRIEVELMNFLQGKKDRQRITSYDFADVMGTSSENLYSGLLKNSISGNYLANEGSRILNLSYDSNVGGSVILDDNKETSSQNSETGDKASEPVHFGDKQATSELYDTESMAELKCYRNSISDIKTNSFGDTRPSVPQILRLICSSDNESSDKKNAICQLIDVSTANDQSIWSNYFNQILTSVLDVLDDNAFCSRETVIELIMKMLTNQKELMEDSIEIVIEKLLLIVTNAIPKVSTESEHCLSLILSQYDHFRFMSVENTQIVIQSTIIKIFFPLFQVLTPLLATEDEKILVSCINCLTKLLGRFSQEELVAQLPSFLPSLVHAFGNKSADVRKTVVFCLVEMHIMLGKAFVPYMEGLSSTQMRLVTIYANRIALARTGTPLEASN